MFFEQEFSEWLLCNLRTVHKRVWNCCGKAVLPGGPACGCECPGSQYEWETCELVENPSYNMVRISTCTSDRPKEGEIESARRNNDRRRKDLRFHREYPSDYLYGWDEEEEICKIFERNLGTRCIDAAEFRRQFECEELDSRTMVHIRGLLEELPTLKQEKQAEDRKIIMKKMVDNMRDNEADGLYQVWQVGLSTLFGFLFPE